MQWLPFFICWALCPVLTGAALLHLTTLGGCFPHCTEDDRLEMLSHLLKTATATPLASGGSGIRTRVWLLSQNTAAPDPVPSP